ncbi:MAG: DNA adenine methylase [Nitrosopumilus sp.]|nr:DNA adenine methylase [Nitrosopumilus sp.]
MTRQVLAPPAIRRPKRGRSGRRFEVMNRAGSRPLKLIPYIGCKSGFAHIFDALIPDRPGTIYDIFGGGGGFAFYACDRFGSQNVVYNDHNPVITNLIRTLQESPEELYRSYARHARRSDPAHYLDVRRMDLEDGARGAGRFFYLAKNAFSGKIRFNSGNRFNAPMRKGAACPSVDRDDLVRLSEVISRLRIREDDFWRFRNRRGGFMYLDPPYMNNGNGHYNATVPTGDFVDFVRHVQRNNRVMISEQNSMESLGLRGYRTYGVTLRRSLQYVTQSKSREVVAINYRPPARP